MNGEPLPIDHGYPARLIVAGFYGYVSATKWLTELELTRFEDFDSFWVERGWAREGPIKLQSRIDVPRNGATVPAGLVTMAGVAWAPSIGISAVEVKIDDSRGCPPSSALAAPTTRGCSGGTSSKRRPGTTSPPCGPTTRRGSVQTDVHVTARAERRHRLPLPQHQRRVNAGGPTVAAGRRSLPDR